MNKFIKVALVGAVLATLTACTGHIENRDRNTLTTTCCTRQFLFLKSLAVAVLLHSKSLTEIG